MSALILIGHGSHLSADSSEPVYRHAETIRRMGVFDEVRECFWKEEPSMREIFDLVEADEVYAVPLFISEGYFTREVIPRELGLSGPAPSVTRTAGKTVHYCAPVGTHPWMTGMILRRAEETAGMSDEEAARAALVIIGHGTERNSSSAQAIHQVTGEARRIGKFERVETGFLDQHPEVRQVVEALSNAEVVLVPFFISEGWHTQETIPDDLGLQRPAVSARTLRDGRTVWYTAPVGTFPEIAEIVLQRAREAGAAVDPGYMADAAVGPGRHSASSVAEARAALLAWVAEGGAAGRTFLELHLLANAPDRYRIRHRADVKRPTASLARYVDPYRARDIARRTRGGEHRPLRTAPNLRRGWTLDDLDASGLCIALDYVYPACVAHWHAERAGTLRMTAWKETAARQSGIYSAVGLLPEPVLRNVVTACCGNAVCLRRVRWPVSAGEPAAIPAPLAEADAPAPTDEGAVVPCPEACSLLVSLARTVLGIERESRAEVAGLGALSGTEAAQLREIVAAEAAGTVGAAREGEFEIPTNLRRIRYLAARLAAETPGGG